jgi:hypothetical protein
MNRRAVSATLPLAKAARDTARSPRLDAEAAAVLHRIQALLEQLLVVLSKPPAGPPRVDASVECGWDDKDELRQIWLELSPEQRAILKFIRLRRDSVLTYLVIADNLIVPRLPGDSKSESMSDRTVAKHCLPMLPPPLSLIRRRGDRSGIQLTDKGNRLVRLHAAKDFS